MQSAFDSESDSDGGYGPTIPTQAPPSQTAAVENKEPEPQPEQPADQPAPEMPVSQLEPDQKAFQLQVAQVQNSGLVQALQSGSLSESDAENCRQIIGYCPRNLLNKQVQRSMIADGHPALQAAFKNKMLRAFLMGVNSASLTLGCGMISLEISRFLLTECVKKLGLNSQCRAQLLPICSKINAHVGALDQKRRAFVLHMAEMSKNMGTVNNLLRYGAGAEAIVERLEGFNMDLRGQMDNIHAEADLSLDEITKGGEYIMSVLREDDSYQRKEADIRRLDAEWQTARAEYERHLQEFKEAEYGMEGTLKVAQTDLKTLQTQRNFRQASLNEITQRLERHQAKIVTYEAAIRRVEDGAAMDEKEAQQLADETIAATKQEVRDQREGIQKQIKMLEDEIRKKSHQSEDYRNRSQTATDGMERQTTYRRHGYWWRWWSSYSYESKTVQARPNEKQRLQAMAATVESEKQSLHNKIQQLREKSKTIKDTMMKQMTSDTLKIRNDVSEANSSIRDRRINQIRQQAKYMQALVDNASAEQASILQELKVLDAQIAEMETLVKTTSDKLAVHRDPANPQMQALEAVRQTSEGLRKPLFAAKKELQDYASIFGAGSGDDFTSFMRIFNMLDGSIKKLPQTLEGLQDAFTVASATFNSEVFGEDLRLLAKSGGNVNLYLSEQTDEMHAMCELAFQEADMPGRALMSVNHKQALAAIQSSMVQQNAIEDGSGPVIEEVKEE